MIPIRDVHGPRQVSRAVLGWFQVSVKDSSMWMCQKRTYNRHRTMLVYIGTRNLGSEQVEDEVNDLADKNWDRQVCKLCDPDFALVFPTKESFCIMFHGGGLCLPN